MKNLRHRVVEKIVNSKKDFLKWTSKSNYVVQYLTTIGKIKTKLTLNKPANVRMCILASSKVPMNEFHYDYIKNKYGNKASLLFTDTGSLVCQIDIENVYYDFSKNKEMFD